MISKLAADHIDAEFLPKMRGIEARELYGAESSAVHVECATENLRCVGSWERRADENRPEGAGLNDEDGMELDTVQ